MSQQCGRCNGEGCVVERYDEPDLRGCYTVKCEDCDGTGTFVEAPTCPRHGPIDACDCEILPGEEWRP